MSTAVTATIAGMDKSDLTQLIQQSVNTALDSKLTELMTTLSASITATVMAAVEEKLKHFEIQLDNKYKTEIATVHADYAELNQKLIIMTKRCDTLERDVKSSITSANDLEQYGRRWLIRIHGLPVPVTPASEADPTPAEAAASRPNTRSTSVPGSF